MKLQEIETVAALCGVEPANVEKKDEGFLVCKYDIRFWVDDFEYVSTEQGLQLVDPLDHEHLYGSDLTVYPADGGAPIFVLTDYYREAHYDFFRVPVWAKTLGRADYADYQTPLIDDREAWLDKLTLAHNRAQIDALGGSSLSFRTVVPGKLVCKDYRKANNNKRNKDVESERLPEFNVPIQRDHYELLGDYALLDKQIEELELMQDDEMFYVVGIIERGLVLPMAKLWEEQMGVTTTKKSFVTKAEWESEEPYDKDELFDGDQLEPID